MLQVKAPSVQLISEKMDICRPPSPFAGERLASLAALSFVEGSLTRPQLITEEHEAENCGQLLASAIYNGALLDQRLWDAWLSALHHGIRFKHDSLWIELTLPGSEALKIAPENRGTRWFADPITEMLILRWRSGGGASGTHDATTCLNAFLASCHEFGEEQKNPTQIFLSCAELRWRLRMPGLLVDYARGGGPSLSIHRARWSRLVRGRPVYVGKPVRSVNREKSGETQNRAETPPPEEFSSYPDFLQDETKSSLDIAMAILREFKHFRSASIRTKFEKKLIALSNSRSIPVNEFRILEYIIYRTKDRVSNGYTIRRVSKIYLYNILSCLKSSLLPYLDETEDIVDMAQEDIYEIYNEVIFDKNRYKWEKV